MEIQLLGQHLAPCTVFKQPLKTAQFLSDAMLAQRKYPTEVTLCSPLNTCLCPFTVSLSIRASQPTKSLVTGVSIMNATFDYLCYSTAAHISLPATTHV